MLAKTVWKFQDDQTSIWARVLKWLYFPREKFTKAKKGMKSSWAWASILTGRDVLQTHGVWLVGCGMKIRVFHEAWVPGIQGYGFRQAGGEATQENLGVEQLITPGDMKWDLDRIMPITTEEERGAIKSIHLSKKWGDDKLLCLTTTSRVATPKRVYRRLRELEPETSNLNRGGDGQNEEDTKTVNHVILKCDWARGAWFGRMRLRWDSQEET